MTRSIDPRLYRAPVMNRGDRHQRYLVPFLSDIRTGVAHRGIKSK